MRAVKKLQPFPPKPIDPPQKAIIPREEAMAALTIYFLSKSLPTPSYILEKQFLEEFGHTWQTTSDEIWGYLKDVQPNFARTPQDIYDGYIKLASRDLTKDDEIKNITNEDYITLEDYTNSDKEPVKIKNTSSTNDDKESKKTSHWIYKGYVYAVTQSYSDEECQLLILEDFDKERRYFEKLKAKFDNTQTDIEYKRPRIPEHVRIEVWRRDGGKCARCGSREKLEYDHIVPISKGESNTARNIELLCEKHNRSKSNNVV